MVRLIILLIISLSTLLSLDTGYASSWAEHTPTKITAKKIFKKPLLSTPRLLSGMDVWDDDILRFVSRSVPLTDKMYAPSPLVSISGAYINEAWRVGYLRADARAALGDLAKAFYDEFGTRLVVISGYRSAAYQQRLWDLGRCTDSLCAPPGHSEHQLGLAIDIFDATTEDDFLANSRYMRYVSWTQANAHLYGWTQSYQKWEAIDGYEVEPWHWRYIGIDMATRLKNLRWTYTEYVRFQDNMFGW